MKSSRAGVSVSCLREGPREWMEPGGSHGLQNRSRPDHVGLGGFDSHALPPRDCARHVFVNAFMISRIRALFIVVAVAMLGVVATPLEAQRVDTVTRAAALQPPITPRRAFFYSFLLPGYSQTVLGRHKAAAAFMLAEAISLAMIRESAADVNEARRTENDTLIVTYVDASGQAIPTKAPPFFTDRDVRARRAHVEDWAAFLVANHLFAGADAFVAAHLWDVPQRLGLRVYPRGGGAVVSASFKW